MDIVIIKRNGDLDTKTLDGVHNLYKKCNYRKIKDFENYAEWKVKVNKTKYRIQMHGKTVGKANMENKYDFPPPIADTLFFGDCAVVRIVDGQLHSLSIDEWTAIYEKLFGGFENLDDTIDQDNNEIDELADIPKHMKTKTGGYLKDGFVVDDDSSGGTSEDGTGEDCAGEDCAGEDGTCEDGAGEDGTCEDGTCEDGTCEDGASEDGASEDGASEDGASEADTSEADTCEADTSEADTCEADTSEADTSEADTSEDSELDVEDYIEES
jgi:hypothetical protein